MSSYMDELDPFEKEPKRIILFDAINEEEELTVSGNEDPMDSIHSVCSSCGGTNGQHSLSCDEDFI